ncbi:NAD(P)H-dependent oxidoreductase [Sinomicrobium weinanense]|uniref:NAD(P)H-dependent oxidoreductase n=1 Tax=Sinomicrobium weinanense TaxID=2842200 RepID=A0A926JSM4_9FLAO|nr:NAD(P)H-dependent oxidoreductase [Sinomicrobium weinanense]MBC9796512.1 NAD(P)H-dependent oxidoreductase [Sinomicrobium weinanense]MBU3123528.1 NAD(P)H-dependent oxidoreductase [Sinomicrobium weinanense]
MSTIIESLNWRYATKKFDPSKKVSAEDLATLKEAIRLSASSYGLQPYEVLVIEDPEIRKQLKEVSWGQPQITDASHLIVFANKTNVTAKDTETYMNNISKTRNIPVESLSGFNDMINNTVVTLPEDVKNTWTAKQTYLALGSLLATAAELRIDACPMEGFDAEGYNKILGLDKKGLNAAVIATIGYRSEEDDTQHYAKVRRTAEELFTTL